MSEASNSAWQYVSLPSQSIFKSYSYLSLVAQSLSMVKVWVSSSCELVGSAINHR